MPNKDQVVFRVKAPGIITATIESNPKDFALLVSGGKEVFLEGCDKPYFLLHGFNENNEAIVDSLGSYEDQKAKAIEILTQKKVTSNE